MMRFQPGLQLCRVISKSAIALVACAGISEGHAQIISTPNTLYRIAGGSLGQADGIGAKAQFNQPARINYYDGVLIVQDKNNRILRRIHQDGSVETFGDASGICGSKTRAYRSLANREMSICTPDVQPPLYVPGTPFNAHGFVSDKNNVFYLADTGNSAIRRINPAESGALQTYAGTVGQCTCADGKAAAAGFCQPMDVALDTAGNLYVADTLNHAIRKISPDRQVSTLAGKGKECGAVDGPANSARFCKPVAIAFDSETGSLYVADREYALIRKITPDGTVTTVAGTPNAAANTKPGALPGSIAKPNGITVIGPGRLAITTMENEVIGVNLQIEKGK